MEASVAANQFMLGIILVVGALGIAFLCWVLLNLNRESRKRTTGEGSVQRIRRRIVSSRQAAGRTRSSERGLAARPTNKTRR
jgi:hypothetical protein